MKTEKLHAYLVSRPGAIEDRPFGPDVPVYKVMGKMFAYVSPDQSPPRLTIKLDPLHGQLLRATYDAVRLYRYLAREFPPKTFLDSRLWNDPFERYVGGDLLTRRGSLKVHEAATARLQQLTGGPA